MIYRMLEYMFPFSYIILVIGVILGTVFTCACIGIFSSILIFLCIFFGIIKITPLIELCKNLINLVLPNTLKTIEENIYKSYQAIGDLEPGRYIFMWHPHGAFSSSMFFHTATNITNWPSQLRNTKSVALNLIQWFPFLKELSQEINVVFSNYHSMKSTLERGESIAVSAGGMREMLYEHTALLKRRRGIFKMALETGTPLVPVISVGDTRLWEIVKLPVWIQDILEPYDLCIPIPTLKSIQKCLGILQYPLKDPIHSIIGEPILVPKHENPKESDIDDLRSRYIEALQKMYLKETGEELKIA
jgi:hypothetical protein